MTEVVKLKRKKPTWKLLKIDDPDYPIPLRKNMLIYVRDFLDPDNPADSFILAQQRYPGVFVTPDREVLDDADSEDPIIILGYIDLDDIHL